MSNLFSMIEVEINKHCNRKCSYCPNSKVSNTNNVIMDFNLFTRLVNQLVEIGYKGRISYHFYNEPLLNKDINKYVRLVRDRLSQCNQILYTNGDLLTVERYNTLKDSGVKKFIVTKHEGKVINKDLHLRRHKYVDGDEYLIVLMNDELLLTNRGGALDHISPGRIDETRTKVCTVPLTMLIVTHSGDILPCYEDYYRTTVMGNILDTHILDIWRNTSFEKFRNNCTLGNRTKNNLCTSCNNGSHTSYDEYEYLL